MIKAVMIMLISVLLISCGSRKKELEKQISEINAEKNVDLQKTESLNSKTQSTIDFTKLFSEKGLKISSDGQPYELRYGGFFFSGSAGVEFTEKKENTEFHYRYLDHITYQTKTQYKTHTTYKTVTKSKNLKIERDAYPFWIFILIGFIGNVFLKFVWNKFKISTWQLDVWERLSKKR